jgi:hypothetical protein
MKHARNQLILYCALAIILLSPLLLLSFSTLKLHPTFGAHNSQYSQNWAGYVLTPQEFGFNKQVLMVNGTFTVPYVYHTSLSDIENTSIWLGIDGYQNNNLIQTGVDCQNADGTSICYPWYELIPSKSTTITNFTVKPGDTILAQITLINATHSLWNIYLADLSNGGHFSINVYYPTLMSSAEWVVEAPELNNIYSPLPSFSTVQFNDAHLYVHGILFGQYYSLGQISPHILFINQSNTNAANPSAVLPDNTSFNVYYSGVPQIPARTYLNLVGSYTSRAYLGNNANISAQIYANHSIVLAGGQPTIVTSGLLQSIPLSLYSDGTLVSQATTNQTGVAMFNYGASTLGAGTHSLHVSYAGNQTYQQTTSQSVSVTVMQLTSPTSQYTTIPNAYSSTVSQNNNLQGTTPLAFTELGTFLFIVVILIIIYLVYKFFKSRKLKMQNRRKK